MLSFRRSLHDGRAGARAWLAMLLLALLTTAPSAPSALAQQSANVGPEVLATLRAGRSAAVVVALAAPASLAGGRLDLAKARAEIADAQAAVLATVDASEFQLRERFSAIPALAGSVLDERGLAKLASHPAVVRIDLDTGGAGHLANSVPLLGANR